MFIDFRLGLRLHARNSQSFSTAQRYRKYLQPERIDQIMLDERLNEICASWQITLYRSVNVCGWRWHSRTRPAVRDR
jgi:hypothetical protein